MVECGACDERFKVEGSAIIRQKKHYPGEKSEMNTKIYAKSPNIEDAKNGDVAFQTANYQNVNAEYATPPKPQKTFAICVGALFIILFIIVFLIGGREDGMLKDLDNADRLILACFVAIAGSCLILIGSVNKSKGLFLSLILGGALIAMPFIFPEVIDSKIISKPAPDIVEKTILNTVPESSFNQELVEYSKNIGFEKVEAARASLTDPSALKAIILRNSKVVDLDTILPFLQYNLGLEETPASYPYGRQLDDENVTLVIFETDTPFEIVYNMTKRFGDPQEMNEVRNALQVIEVVVDRETLAGRASSMINDPNHADYFDANHAELRSIDRSKQLNAARRLQSSTNKGRQADIAVALSDLINVNDHEVSRQAISTLYYWNLPEYKTDEKVIAYAKEIVATPLMHRSVMDYLADKDIEGSVAILAEQWASDKGHLIWENHLVRAERRGEKAVLSTLSTLREDHFRSAANILSKVGTRDSIAAINELLPRIKEDDKKYFKAAIDEIKSRQ